MKSVDAHLQQVLATVAPLRELEVRLLDAHGCVLAEDVAAGAAVPARDVAAADGYALRSADVAAAAPQAPVSLHVIGDIAAGTAPNVAVQPGLAARVVTGAVMPPGADAVVPTQWTDGGLAQVLVARAVPAAAFVRTAGSDLAAGGPALARDTVIGAAQIALLVAAGRRNVLVRPKPRVVVASVGGELVEPGRDLLAGQVADASGYALAAAVREAGAIAFLTGIVPDDPKRLADVLEDHLPQADLVVVAGGLRGGGYDVVRDVLARLGSASFEEVAMHPGGVQGFGVIGSEAAPVFALPGDAVGALAAFEVFVRPALRRMLGAETVGRPHVSAVATRELASPAGRRQFVRARVERSADRWVVTPTGDTLAGLGSANALAVVPEDATEVVAGTPLLTWLLERRGI